ncbi:MAG: universal stress protein [Bacteroidetes bacterium]|nr:universal stress protein [Bacteroidota bacterium]
MEKILLALDGTSFNQHAVDFACYLGRLTNSMITASFLENLVANEKPVLEQMHGVSYMNWVVDKNSEEYKLKIATVEKNISLFRDSCEKRAVRYSIHRDEGQPAKEIIEESRYADVLIIDAETSFTKIVEGVPSEFVRDVLKEAECPVIIAPESFDSIDEIVFTFNGTKSSMFAIKQFTYLFPQLDEKKITVVMVDEEGLCTDDEIEKFKEWLSGHYSSIGFQVLKGNTETELFGYLLKKKNIFIVMGAYGRSAISQLFKHSRADLLIRTITQSIFIAHQ